MGRESLYLAAKTLLAQVQGCLPPSIPLIQATLLLAVYEYANGRPEVAFVTVAACARMAYGARIHDRRHLLHKASRLEVEEAANTWWGIVLCERAFLSEVDDLEQPMATTLPPGDSQLPVGREVLDRGEIINSGSIPNNPVSCVATAGIGGFGRAAQACCLLDQVLRGLVISDVNTKLPLLESLDRTIQSFLSLLLTRTEHKVLPYCTALAVTVRMLFTLHTHILNIPHQVTHANLRTLDEWKKGSLAALDTATTMAIDMAHCHRADLPADGTNNTSPIHIYVVSAAIRHMRTRLRTGNRDTLWPESAEDELGSYLRRLQNQWVA
ncbi:fungal specific transcription factor domain-containing protein [Aspergillus lucknowensis]|uniref:Transcription factor domain-containing protein n=1 Tax=Aspergillus lucknowensis TaxID=176173 RepID=A0ABR4LD99_9EURO